MTDKFEVGNRVLKKEGYEFDSYVVSVFTDRSDETHVVCESILMPGVMRIFSPDELRHAKSIWRCDNSECARVGFHFYAYPHPNNRELSAIGCPFCTFRSTVMTEGVSRPIRLYQHIQVGDLDSDEIYQKTKNLMELLRKSGF